MTPGKGTRVLASDREVTRLGESVFRSGAVSEEDNAWFGKAKTVGIRQVFMPDVLPTTLMALFVACCSTCIYGTVGAWMPLYLATEKHWSTTEYSLFYVFYGITGFLGLMVVGWLIDRIGRRPGALRRGPQRRCPSQSRRHTPRSAGERPRA